MEQQDIAKVFTSGFSIDRIPLAVIEASLDTFEILKVNRQALSLFGCESPEEFSDLTGGNLFGIMDPLDRQVMRWKVTSAKEIETGLHLRFRTNHKKNGASCVDSIFYETGGILFALPVSTQSHEAGIDDIDDLTALPWQNRFFRDVEVRLVENRTSPAPKQNFLLYFNLTNFHRVNVRFDAATGDALLQKTVEILKAHYPGDLISRVAADHFVIFTDRADAGERAEASHQDLALAADEISPGIPLSLRSGMCEVPSDYAGDISVLVDYAKVACSSWSGGAAVHFHLYQDVQDSYEKRSYIIEHVDEAIANGEITVFYQPVIRSLTGQLCGFEGLARWNSKDLGFLSPGAFIPVLEDSYQIYKVDLCILDQICRKIRATLDAGEPVVPISFNLSRHDFIGRDMAELVEQKVASYEVPRELIHIEITESAAEKSRELLLEQVNRFHALGYEVWMDDFGSGYSSLNVLKDFPFDEIKIDMAFLHPFTEASRKIVASIVRMAKTIGVHTLAEGVETKEQVIFLKNIGCEKLQGYYYGKPLPQEEAMKNLQSKGVSIEPQALRTYYGTMGSLDLQTDQPLFLAERTGRKITGMYANERCRQVLLGIGCEVNEDGAVPDAGEDMVLKHLLELLLKIPKRREKLGLSPLHVVENGHYLHLEVQQVAEAGEREAFSMIITDLSTGEKKRENRQLDTSVRSILRLCSRFVVIDPDRDTASVRCLKGIFLKVPKNVTGLREYLDSRTRRYIAQDEWEAYLAFLDPATMKERLKKASGGQILELFRTRTEHGEYHPSLHTLYGTRDGKVLYMVRDLSGLTGTERYLDRSCTRTGTGAENRGSYAAPADLWHSCVEDLNLCFFWKDTKRRFLGASQAFLDYYGLSGLDEIVGKTDEEVGWNVDEKGYRDDELKVIEEGRTVHRVPGKCLIRGKICNIQASKAPVYHDGKIVGLVGYFLDVDAIEARGDHTRTDALTGCLNPRGILETAIESQDKERIAGEKFAILHVLVPAYDEIRTLYGREVSDALLQEIAVRILNAVRTFGSVGRMSGADFVVFLRLESGADPNQVEQKMKTDLGSISRVKGSEVTLRPKVTRIRETAKDTDNDLIYRIVSECGFGERSLS